MPQRISGFLDTQLLQSCFGLSLKRNASLFSHGSRFLLVGLGVVGLGVDSGSSVRVSDAPGVGSSVGFFVGFLVLGTLVGLMGIRVGTRVGLLHSFSCFYNYDNDVFVITQKMMA